ncbi:MAG: hypothetical protein ACYDEN_05745 [Acidimicrobiales bacterium]
MKRVATLLLSMGMLFGAVAATSVATASAAPAVAQHKDCYPHSGLKTCTHTGGTGGSTMPSGSTTTPASATIGAATTGLAFTGADVAMTVAVAALLVGLGLVIVRLTRRRIA